MLIIIINLRLRHTDTVLALAEREVTDGRGILTGGGFNPAPVPCGTAALALPNGREGGQG